MTPTNGSRVGKCASIPSSSHAIRQHPVYFQGTQFHTDESHQSTVQSPEAKGFQCEVFELSAGKERINQWALLYFDNTSTCSTSSTIPVAHNACLEMIQTMLQIWANHLWNMRLCKKTRTQPCPEMGLAILETDLNGIQWFSLHLLGHYKYLEIECSSIFILFSYILWKRLIPLTNHTSICTFPTKIIKCHNLILYPPMFSS